MIARRISFAERLEDFLFDRGLDDAVGMRYRRSATPFCYCHILFDNRDDLPGAPLSDGAFNSRRSNIAARDTALERNT